MSMKEWPERGEARKVVCSCDKSDDFPCPIHGREKKLENQLIEARELISRLELIQINPSVQPEWCKGLPIQQQSVLFLASRGPDGIPKDHPCKDVQRAYRGTVFVAAVYGRPLEYGERGDTFMSLDKFGDKSIWQDVCDKFFLTVDVLPHHFYMHLLHGAQILGYKHPDPRFRVGWLNFYLQGVNDLHLCPETMADMDARLCDWNCNHWGARPVMFTDSFCRKDED